MPVPDYMRTKRPAPAAPQVQRSAPAAAAPQVSVKDQLKQSTADKNMEVILSLRIVWLIEIWK